MKYIFKQIDDISRNSAETTVEFSADTLSDVLQQFELFVRGCGFFPPEGNLDYVNDFEEPHEWHTPEWETPKFEPAQELYDEMDYGVSPSVAMQWTVKELQKGPMTVESVTNICPVCKIDNETMKQNKCWDKNCPKGNDAN